MVERVFSGAPCEAVVGYCRAVRALIESGMLIEVEMDTVCAPDGEG